MRENCTSGDNGGWHSARSAFYPLDIRTYGVDPGIGVGPRSASFVPLELTLIEGNDGFTVIGHRQPGDGANHWPDIKQIFPEEYKTGRGQEMERAIKDKDNSYLKNRRDG